MLCFNMCIKSRIRQISWLSLTATCKISTYFVFSCFSLLIFLRFLLFFYFFLIFNLIIVKHSHPSLIIHVFYYFFIIFFGNWNKLVLLIFYKVNILVVGDRIIRFYRTSSIIAISIWHFVSNIIFFPYKILKYAL